MTTRRLLFFLSLRFLRPHKERDRLHMVGSPKFGNILLY